MNRGLSPAQTLNDATSVIRHKCGCELLVLASGISLGRKRCKDAERLHKNQTRLSKRLMSFPEGSEAEQKLIAKIGGITDALAAHRQKASIRLAESSSESTAKPSSETSNEPF